MDGTGAPQQGTGDRPDEPVTGYADAVGADVGGSTEAPVVSGDDVRPGPEFTDTPAAGATEPSD